MSLTGPTVLAFEQLDPIVHQVARQTTIGSCRASAAEGDRPSLRQFRTTFLASKAIVRLVAPRRVMIPVASMKSPARTGATNSTSS